MKLHSWQFRFIISVNPHPTPLKKENYPFNIESSYSWLPSTCNFIPLFQTLKYHVFFICCHLWKGNLYKSIKNLTSVNSKAFQNCLISFNYCLFVSNSSALAKSNQTFHPILLISAIQPCIKLISMLSKWILFGKQEFYSYMNLCIKNL